MTWPNRPSRRNARAASDRCSSCGDFTNASVCMNPTQDCRVAQAFGRSPACVGAAPRAGLELPRYSASVRNNVRLKAKTCWRGCVAPLTKNAGSLSSLGFLVVIYYDDHYITIVV